MWFNLGLEGARSAWPDGTRTGGTGEAEIRNLIRRRFSKGPSEPRRVRRLRTVAPRQWATITPEVDLEF